MEDRRTGAWLAFLAAAILVQSASAQTGFDGEEKAWLDNGADNVLEKVVGRSQEHARLTFRNPNDVTVWVELSGGVSGRHSMPPKRLLELPIEAGRATTVSYFATDPQYKEYGRANARTETITGNTDLTLTLTRQEAPVLTVANAGDVKLSVILRSSGDGRVLGNGPVDVQKAVKFSGLPVGDPLSLEWTSDGVPGCQRGSKALEGLSWGQAATVDIKAECLAGPKLELRNVSSWPLNVQIDGVEPFRLEVDGRETVLLPRSGRYRVKTTVIPNKRMDAFPNPADYESTDETVDCLWGQSYTLYCSANVKRPENAPDDVNADQYEAYGESILKSKLKGAKAIVDEPWPEHGAVGNVERIDMTLREAKRFSLGVDVDAIVPDPVSYSGWRRSVASKASYRNATWQRIVEATEASGSWREFFARY